MKALPVVENLEVLKDIGFCLLTAIVVAVMNQVLLERCKETLHQDDLGLMQQLGMVPPPQPSN